MEIWQDAGIGDKKAGLAAIFFRAVLFGDGPENVLAKAEAGAAEGEKKMGRDRHFLHVAGGIADVEAEETAVLEHPAAFLEHVEQAAQVGVEIGEVAVALRAAYAEIKVRGAGDYELDGFAGQLLHLSGVADDNKVVRVHERGWAAGVSIWFMQNMAITCCFSPISQLLFYLFLLVIIIKRWLGLFIDILLD